MQSLGYPKNFERREEESPDFSPVGLDEDEGIYAQVDYESFDRVFTSRKRVFDGFPISRYAFIDALFYNSSLMTRLEKAIGVFQNEQTMENQKEIKHVIKRIWRESFTNNLETKFLTKEFDETDEGKFQYVVQLYKIETEKDVELRRRKSEMIDEEEDEAEEAEAEEAEAEEAEAEEAEAEEAEAEESEAEEAEEAEGEGSMERDIVPNLSEEAMRPEVSLFGQRSLKGGQADEAAGLDGGQNLIALRAYKLSKGSHSLNKFGSIEDFKSLQWHSYKKAYVGLDTGKDIIVKAFVWSSDLKQLLEMIQRILKKRFVYVWVPQAHSGRADGYPSAKDKTSDYKTLALWALHFMVLGHSELSKPKSIGQHQTLKLCGKLLDLRPEDFGQKGGSILKVRL